VKTRSVPDPGSTSGEHTKEQQEASAVAAFLETQGAGPGQAESAPAEEDDSTEIAAAVDDKDVKVTKLSL